eukprot:jgi/Botrbrau1/22877/Bobra.0065s0035.3
MNRAPGQTEGQGHVNCRAVRAVAAFFCDGVGSQWCRSTTEQRCLERLIRLETPLGGEVEAIIRELDPQSPVLKAGWGANALPYRLEGDPNCRIIPPEQQHIVSSNAAHAAGDQDSGSAGRSSSVPGTTLPAKPPGQRQGSNPSNAQDLFDEPIFATGGFFAPWDSGVRPAADSPTKLSSRRKQREELRAERRAAARGGREPSF